ncbi:hypothetical protein DPEC_G00362220 [Dallia pectoralis]|nr:hypothetical protein DPEC_G00362220 [Dallia pectoralis]
MARKLQMEPINDMQISVSMTSSTLRTRPSLESRCPTSLNTSIRFSQVLEREAMVLKAARLQMNMFMDCQCVRYQLFRVSMWHCEELPSRVGRGARNLHGMFICSLQPSAPLKTGELLYSGVGHLDSAFARSAVMDAGPVSICCFPWPSALRLASTLRCHNIVTTMHRATTLADIWAVSGTGMVACSQSRVPIKILFLVFSASPYTHHLLATMRSPRRASCLCPKAPCHRSLRGGKLAVCLSTAGKSLGSVAFIWGCDTNVNSFVVNRRFPRPFAAGSKVALGGLPHLLAPEACDQGVRQRGLRGSGACGQACVPGAEYRDQVKLTNPRRWWWLAPHAAHLVGEDSQPEAARHLIAHEHVDALAAMSTSMAEHGRR